MTFPPRAMIQPMYFCWQLIHVLYLLELHRVPVLVQYCKENAGCKSPCKKEREQTLNHFGFGATQERLQDSGTDSVIRSAQPGQRKYISELQKGFVTQTDYLLCCSSILTVRTMKFSFHQDTQLRLQINCYHLCVISGKFGPSGLITRFAKCTYQVFIIFFFGSFRPTRELFTHLETSSLQVKSSKCWPIICSHGHWTTRVIKRAKLTVTRDIHLWWPSPKTHDS